MFEAQLLEGLKKDFNIKTNKYNKTIKLLIKQYIRSEISKPALIDILKGFASEG